MTADTVVLTLASPVLPDQTVTVSYTPPTASPIQDAAGNDAAALTNEAVDVPTGTLTASFVDVPSKHAGPGEQFTFELAFSESPKTGYQKLRGDAFTVTGGTIRRAQRLEAPSNIRWQITVEPSGWGDVALSLPGGRTCTTTGAICTGDNRMLSNSPSATVQGSAALWVADATSKADEGRCETQDAMAKCAVPPCGAALLTRIRVGARILHAVWTPQWSRRLAASARMRWAA